MRAESPSWLEFDVEMLVAERSRLHFVYSPPLESCPGNAKSVGPSFRGRRLVVSTLLKPTLASGLKVDEVMSASEMPNGSC